MSELRGIPESSPIGDGPPQQGGHSLGSGPREERRPKAPSLLNGKDEVSFSAPAESALGIFRECVLRSTEEALEVELAHPHEPPALDEPAAESVGEQLCAELAALYQRAEVAGTPDPGERLLEGAREGSDQALEILGRLDLLDSRGGEQVSELLEGWSAMLQRLVDATRPS